MQRLNLNPTYQQNLPGHSELIALSNVSKIYQTDGITCQALREVSLSVQPGEFVAVVGKSGSGKSTLINMITGIDRPSSGQIRVSGAAVHQLNEGQLAVWRGKNVGVVFQFFQLLPTLTALENVLLPMDLCGMFRMSERKQRAMQILSDMGIDDQANKLPSSLSGGQQQRVAIARALANDPPLVVADEPTGNLDTRTAEAVVSLFEQLTAKGKTVLMVTHDRDLAARTGRTIVLSDGLVLSDSSEEVQHVSTTLA
ncbi:MAG: ABC transporter ATP-binding protein [Chloroflexi bacterium HGW-Chloroflexi-10]|nr:MAG: ABC transporter ATP-binding protein [Chloroflexi bacterium HGW-Chloroflexi-10]